MISLNIVYFGTPDFAVESLKILVENNYNIVGVVTAPDKPAGRGHKLQLSAVKQYALSAGLKILQPTNLKSESFIQELSSLNANLQIVVAFRMLPKLVWDMPELGTFNLHGSLLPQYRGAAPINWAIMNGETETGVTTFFLKHEIDEGDVIFNHKVSIGENDNAGVIHDQLMTTGAQLVLKTVKAIELGNIISMDQSTLISSSENLKPAPKIFKADCRIDWNDTMDNIHNKVRGLAPYPTSWTVICNSETEYSLKVFATKKIMGEHSFKPGSIHSTKDELKVAVDGGFIQILDAQLAGKKRMKVNELLRGFSLNKDAYAM